MERPIEYISRDQYEGRSQIVDEHFARDKERLNAHEQSLKKMELLTQEIAALNKNHDDQIRKHDQRICTLERQPADQYGKIKTAIVSSIISGVIGTVIGTILTTPKP
jgi:chromosome segregation ATPase